MRLLEEGMIEFEQQLSTFTEGKKRAEVYLHEMPGGQFTNLLAQAKSLGLEKNGQRLQKPIQK